MKNNNILRPVPTTPERNPAAPAQELVSEIAQAARFARQHAIAAIYRAGSGHPGGALSCADLIASLFGAELNL